MRDISREIRLIVNADDFGLSRGITDGIIVAHRYGFLTSASLVVNAPASKYAASRASSFPRLAVGIHLNICQGRPLLPASEVPALVNSSGYFHLPSEVASLLWTWRIPPSQIEAEFRAQIRWMKERGLTPSHADSHHHMHLYPAAARAFARALELEGIRCARACRCTVWPKARSLGGPHEGSLVRRILVQTYRFTLQRTIFRAIISPDGRISFYSKHRKDLSSLRRSWKLALENVPSGTFELACHPGLFERGFSETDRLNAQREQEMIWLTDRELRDVIDRRGIRLITYRELCASAGVARESAPAVA